MSVDRLFAGLGALSAFLAVAAGAFGAHALPARHTPDDAVVDARDLDRRQLPVGREPGVVAPLLVAGEMAAVVDAARARLSPDLLAVFETGARYQMYHALALLAVAWMVTRWPGPWPVRAGWLFAAGTVLFSGSLYALALTGVRWLGAITPLGGAAFLAGWLCLAWGASRG